MATVSGPQVGEFFGQMVAAIGLGDAQGNELRDEQYARSGVRLSSVGTGSEATLTNADPILFQPRSRAARIATVLLYRNIVDSEPAVVLDLVEPREVREGDTPSFPRGDLRWTIRGN